MLGVYGILSYSLAQRTRELGIRVALGAQRTDVIRYALWLGLAPVLAGLAAGVITAGLLSRLAASLLNRQREVQASPSAVSSGSLLHGARCI